MENNRHLQFVLKHYREGAFNTRSAIDRFKRATGRPKRGFIRYIAVAAAVAAVVSGIFIFNPKPQPVHFMTADVSETFILPDSTRITLAPNSSIEYDARAYVRRSRSVTMEGKAFFDVTRNERNPFEITTSKAYIKVLGTSFQVDGTASGTEVYVKSGKVLFASGKDVEGVILTKGMEEEPDRTVLDIMSRMVRIASGMDVAGVILTLGLEAELSPEESVPQVVADPRPNPAAWATGLFEYESVPLKEVLDELSEYYGVGLEASSYERRLTAKFETAESIDSIIGMIAAATETTITKND